MSLLTYHSFTRVCAPRRVHGHYSYMNSLWSLYQQALPYPVSAPKKDAEKGGLLQGVKEGMKGEASGEGIKRNLYGAVLIF